MARSFSNAKRLSSFFGDKLSVVISKRGLAAAPHGGATAGAAAIMNKGSAESSKPAPRVSEFRSTQIPSMLSFSSRLSTAATPSVASSVTSHARPLSPHLSIYKPQSNSMYSIFSRIAASIISGVALLFYFLYMKTGLICFTYNSFYQLFFGVSGFTELICYSSVPLLLLHIIHTVKH
ncbi:putative Late embryogenesis abundant protein, LEA_3 subgroup [Helianthus annuus]|nr:putative Late embryogenesis abundant protein, LEA_3 subgroup [Helianthus annuus]